MLNSNRVLNFVKTGFGFPYVNVEMEDTAILNYVKDYVIREFSYYVPEVYWMSLNPLLEANQVPSKSNEYYLNEPDGREILNVVDIYFSESDLYLFGHPPLGPMSHGELKEWALAVETSMQTKVFSSFDRTFKFIHPNIVRITPNITNTTYVTVEYERMQSDDFSGIPNEFQQIFCEFALASIMIIIGRIRKKYGDGNLRTPFGEIPLGSEVLDEGTTKKRELIEKLEMGPMMNIVVDHG